ncbi:hypothetical protein [Lacunimicrobium album]
MPETAQAKGIVTYQGKPLPSASVIFTPLAGPIGVGTTDSEGRFTLVTQGQPGALLGEHKVTIQAFKAVGNVVATTDAKTGNEVSVPMTSAIPEKYGMPAKSGLSAKVEKDSPNDFTFELK